MPVKYDAIAARESGTLAWSTPSSATERVCSA
jgi:hypothetical protein